MEETKEIKVGDVVKLTKRSRVQEMAAVAYGDTRPEMRIAYGAGARDAIYAVCEFLRGPCQHDEDSMLIRMSPMTHREPIDIRPPISACLPSDAVGQQRATRDKTAMTARAILRDGEESA